MRASIPISGLLIPLRAGWLTFEPFLRLSDIPAPHPQSAFYTMPETKRGKAHLMSLSFSSAEASSSASVLALSADPHPSPLSMPAGAEEASRDRRGEATTGAEEGPAPAPMSYSSSSILLEQKARVEQSFTSDNRCEGALHIVSCVPLSSIGGAGLATVIISPLIRYFITRIPDTLKRTAVHAHG